MAWHEAEIEWTADHETWDEPKLLRLEYRIQQGAPAYFAGNFADSRPADGDEVEIGKAIEIATGQELALTDRQIEQAEEYIIEHHDWDEEPWSPFSPDHDD